MGCCASTQVRATPKQQTEPTAVDQAGKPPQYPALASDRRVSVGLTNEYSAAFGASPPPPAPLPLPKGPVHTQSLEVEEEEEASEPPAPVRRSAREDMVLLREVSEVNAEASSYDAGMLELVIGDEQYSVLVPEDEYPVGEPVILGEDSVILKSGNMQSIARQVVDYHFGRGKGGGGGLYRETSVMYVGGTDVDPIQTAIQGDAAALKAHFGEATVDVDRRMPTKDAVTIRFPVHRHISRTVARAWGVKHRTDVVMTLTFVSKQYVDQSRPPQVEITQDGERFPVGQQLTRALITYLQQLWKEGITLDDCAPSEDAPLKRQVSTRQAAWDKPKKKINLNKQQYLIKDNLLALGLEEEEAIMLAKQSNDINDALDRWTEGNWNVIEDDSDEEEEVVETTVSASVTFRNYKASTDPNKKVPYNPERGFLSHVLEWFYKRLPTASSYCVLCDQPHVFSQNQLNPAVCTRAICTFAYRELNVGSDSTESVATGKGVIDLLICVFRQAVLSSRIEFVLKPFPNVPHPTADGRLLFDPESPDYSLVKTVTDSFPPSKTIIENGLASAERSIANPNVMPLVHWVINSNRSHIVELPKEQQLPSLETHYQFVYASAGPEKEAMFNKLKKKHGTRFAFHGSHAGNWHAIMRNGLKNMSGTSGQVNGSVHGSGIYFAPKASDSLGYCRPSNAGHANSSDEWISEKEMVVLALCEIIDAEIKHHGWCWTLENESHVITRFLFVYETSEYRNKARSANTDDNTFRNEIQLTMKKVFDE